MLMQSVVTKCSCTVGLIIFEDKNFEEFTDTY